MSYWAKNNLIVWSPRSDNTFGNWKKTKRTQQNKSWPPTRFPRARQTRTSNSRQLVPFKPAAPWPANEKYSQMCDLINCSHFLTDFSFFTSCVVCFAPGLTFFRAGPQPQCFQLKTVVIWEVPLWKWSFFFGGRFLSKKCPVQVMRLSEVGAVSVYNFDLSYIKQDLLEKNSFAFSLKIGIKLRKQRG